MTGTLTKTLNIALAVIVGITVVLTIMFYWGGITAETLGTKYEEPVYTSVYMIWAAILTFITVGLAVVFPIVGMIDNPKNAVKSLISIGAIAVLLIIAYAMSDGTELILPGYTGSDNVEPMLKLADTSLFMMYIFSIGALLSIVYTEVSSLFK